MPTREQRSLVFTAIFFSCLAWAMSCHDAFEERSLCEDVTRSRGPAPSKKERYR